MGWPRAFERIEVVLVGEGEAYVVETLHDALAGEVVHLEGLVDVGGGDRELVEFYGDDGLRVFPDRRKQVLDRLLGQVDGEEAVLDGVVLENVGEGRCDHGPKPVILDGPHGVLAAGP